MKQAIFFFLIITLTSVIQLNAQEKNFLVYELFTSQGCSSCPPADKALREIISESTLPIIALSYHVDYWNYLGWKDPYAHQDFTARQKEYYQYGISKQVYTPQAVINGKIVEVGSRKSSIIKTLSKENEQLRPSPIRISQIELTSGKIAFTLANFQLKDQMELVVAVAQKEVKNAVKNGENSGKRLIHAHVVRGYKKFDSTRPNTQYEVNFPSNIDSEKLLLAVFIQNKNNKAIQYATMKDLN